MIAEIIIFTILGFLGVFFAIFYFASLNEKKRISKLKEFCKNNNFEFSRFHEDDFLNKNIFSDFNLFKRGYIRKPANIMKGKKHNLDWIIFDYHFKTPGGPNNSLHHMHSVFIIKSNKKVSRKKEDGFNIDSNGKGVVFWKRAGREKPENLEETMKKIKDYF